MHSSTSARFNLIKREEAEKSFEFRSRVKSASDKDCQGLFDNDDEYFIANLHDSSGFDLVKHRWEIPLSTIHQFPLLSAFLRDIPIDDLEFA